MSRILGIELRRSAAPGTALMVLVAGAVVLYAATGRWSHGWMNLVLTQREYLLLLWPLALAAGAWQARRELRTNVAELFASTGRPFAHRMVPVLAAMVIAVVFGYLAMTAAAVPSIIDTASYLPATAFAVTAVGGLALAAGVCIGLAVGRLVPSRVTPPVLAVAGYGLLTAIIILAGSSSRLHVVFSPLGPGHSTDYDTVDARVSAAQAIWLAAVALTGAILLISTSRRTRAAAALPALLGAAAAMTIAPDNARVLANSIDPVAQEQVCAEGSPRVCVSRVHAKLLPEVTPLAREALTMLAKLPNAPTTAHEDTTTIFPKISPPRRADVVLIPVELGKNGHLANGAEVVRDMVYAAGVDVRDCGEDYRYNARDVSFAVGHWLMGRSPGPADTEVMTLWESLQRLPEKDATARVAAVRSAALACQDLNGPVNGTAG